jgi:acetylornithine deacetylase/succinyl-diaminopimelate desuccinylase-like protein
MSGRLLALLLALCACGQEWPAGFQQRAMTHVTALAGLGDRVAGTANESKAVAYIETQLKQAGLKVAIEPFGYKTFRLEQASLRLGEETVAVTQLAANVYDPAAIAGEAVFVEPDVVNAPPRLLQAEVDGKLAVTTTPARVILFGLFKKPRAAAVIAPADFEKLKGKTGRAELRIEGQPVDERSANVVATLGPDGAAREVILSAHLDSWTGPGASDNASGVAVLLELARWYAQRGAPARLRLRFVAFGGEESGLLGSRAYLDHHAADLKRCALLFNMDSLGGTEIFAEMRDGVRGQGQFPTDLAGKATVDVRGRWFLLRREIAPEASNVPPWLGQALQEVASGLQVTLRPARQMGTDHAVFAQAGVVATNIAASPGKLHTAEDVPGNLRPANLEQAAKLVAGVVERVK